MFINYSVTSENYTKKHYIKKFQKKYKGVWEITWEGIKEELKRFDQLTGTTIAEEITHLDDIFIFKTEFRIAKSKCSRKKSGNRCILAVNKKMKKINILLVYNKNDIGSKNETAKWKDIVRKNYKEYNFL